MVSRRCNMSCGHCSVESHPKIKTQPTEEELHKLVERLLEAGVVQLQFTGGEPMLRQELVFALMRKAKAVGVRSSMVSNGFWGKKKEKAASILRDLRSAGLDRLALSYDRYHAEFQGPEPLLNILDSVQAMGWDAHINITRTQDEKDLASLVAPFESHPSAHLRFYDIQPVGLAKNLEDTMRAQLGGFCNSCEQATYTDNGRVIACNGPAYFEKSDSALVLGRWRSDESVDEQLKKHADDQILETIRVLGPLALKRELEQLEDFQDYPFKDEYRGMCELCLQVTSDPEAVAALRERLSEPARRAELLARKLVRDKARESVYNRFEINFRVVPLEFLKVLLEKPSFDNEKVFGRADLDWSYHCTRLDRAGLLSLFKKKPLQASLKGWAPSFFWQRVDEAEARPVATRGLEEILRDWYERDGVDGYGALFELAQESLRDLAVADVELETFWRAAKQILTNDLELGRKVKASRLETLRYRILRYLAFREQGTQQNPLLFALFPLIYSSIRTWPQAGLKTLKRLAKIGLFRASRSLPEALHEAYRLGRS